jgi:hypothetical protein
MTTSSCDVAVIGAGMSGLAAALAAVQRGARVAVLEGSDVAGGNARLAAGMFLGARNVEDLHAYIPDGDIALQRLVVADYDASVAWLESLGLAIGPDIHRGDFRRARPMGMGRPGAREPFMERLAECAIERGVDLRLRCRVDAVARSGAGYAVQCDGGPPILARAVVIATGGFAGGRPALERYLGPMASHLMLRTRPGATGDGLRLAQHLGAATKGDMTAFYGHTVPDCPLDPSDWQPITPYFARLGILVNRDGRRFVDESPSLLEELNPQAGFRQPGGKYWLLFDERIRLGDGPAADPMLHKPDWLEHARAVRAPLIEAASIEALCAGLAREGVNAMALTGETDRYNAECRAGEGERLLPPRSRNPIPLERPPFYALRCVAGITATCGGIAIDDQCRVLDRDQRPIGGLFAAGVDAGGVYGRTYCGFLVWSLISGRRAGTAAAGKTREEA